MAATTRGEWRMSNHEIAGEKEGSRVLRQMTEEDEMNGWDEEG